MNDNETDTLFFNLLLHLAVSKLSRLSEKTNTLESHFLKPIIDPHLIHIILLYPDSWTAFVSKDLEL